MPRNNFVSKDGEYFCAVPQPDSQAIEYMLAIQYLLHQLKSSRCFDPNTKSSDLWYPESWPSSSTPNDSEVIDFCQKVARIYWQIGDTPQHSNTPINADTVITSEGLLYHKDHPDLSSEQILRMPLLEWQGRVMLSLEKAFYGDALQGNEEEAWKKPLLEHIQIIQSLPHVSDDNLDNFMKNRNSEGNLEIFNEQNDIIIQLKKKLVGYDLSFFELEHSGNAALYQCLPFIHDIPFEMPTRSFDLAVSPVPDILTQQARLIARLKSVKEFFEVLSQLKYAEAKIFEIDPALSETVANLIKNYLKEEIAGLKTVLELYETILAGIEAKNTLLAMSASIKLFPQAQQPASSSLYPAQQPGSFHVTINNSISSPHTNESSQERPGSPSIFEGLRNFFFPSGGNNGGAGPSSSSSTHGGSSSHSYPGS